MRVISDPKEDFLLFSGSSFLSYCCSAACAQQYISAAAVLCEPATDESIYLFLTGRYYLGKRKQYRLMAVTW